MLIAKVVGTVVSTIKHPSLHRHKLLLVQPLHLPGQEDLADFIALDVAHAGIGDTVLVNQEGGGGRIVLQDEEAPVISLIVGVLDSVQVDGDGR
ncbi:MAG: EutN/CcmL family microcompartment protein [Caldilineales bacterium]|nr:EutN/CcmL family microcompartment protein [Caldilineales bacterium]